MLVRANSLEAVSCGSSGTKIPQHHETRWDGGRQLLVDQMAADSRRAN